MVTVPIWLLVIVAGAIIYLIFANIHLHKRIQRLERVCRKLEGIGEADHKEEIRRKMTQYDDGGN